MLSQRDGARTHKARFAFMTVVGLQFAVVGPVMAQAAAPAGGTREISEAARRQAESPYRFILQNAAIRERPKAAPEKAAATDVVREAKPERRPAATEVASVPTRTAPQPVAAPEPANAPPPAPVPVAIAAPQAQPAPVAAARKELVAIKQDPPELSPALMRERPTGAVTVAFDVMPDGNVTGVKVVHSSNTKLNRPSMAAIQGWKFKPVDEVRQLEFDFKFE